MAASINASSASLISLPYLPIPESEDTILGPEGYETTRSRSLPYKASPLANHMIQQFADPASIVLLPQEHLLFGNPGSVSGNAKTALTSLAVLMPLQAHSPFGTF